MVNPDLRKAYLDLSNLFRGGRISGWAERNTQALLEGEIPTEELDRLNKLSPGFAEKTQNLQPEDRLMLIKDALARADQSPLSATRIAPTRRTL